MTTRIVASILLLIFVVPPGFAGANPLGFSSQSMENEAKYEAIFMAVPSPQKERSWLEWLTEEPHPASSPADRKTAEYVRDRFIEFGLETEIAPYEVYLNIPKSQSLTLLVPEKEELSLREEGIPRDKDSYSTDAYPAFHGYGASGHVQGQVVYVNYGTRDDFDRLDKLGLSVSGKIAMMRYGGVFRGLKVREAQDRGAIGVILYSDPADDGYMKGDIYPDGPMRPPSAIQRGSVQFNSEAAGDPTTPGYASVKGAKHIAAADARIPKIPSLPIAYGEAQKILRAMAGQRVPDEWQGGLPFAYHLGPGPAEVEMNVQMDYALREIWNVIGKFPGSTEKDRLVILGNHRDAWTYGAVDPNSGTASLLETARGLGEAWKAGWRPKRTVILASWDAEEYGLLGSTEWGEDHADNLTKNALAYINLDSSVTGPDLSVNGVPSLRDLMVEVTAAVPEPKAGKTIYDAWQKNEAKDWATSHPVDLSNPDEKFYLNLGSLGSGSDYTVFLDHLAIPSVNFEFDGPYGVYHSIYDNFYWMTHFGDPEFLYHAAASRIYGLLAMRLSTADIAPFHFTPYALHLRDDIDSIRRSNVVDNRKYTGADSKKKPPLKPDYTPLIKAIDDFASAAASLDQTIDQRAAANPDAATAAALTGQLMEIEHQFMDPAGLPRRAWFRHVLFAPGFTTGYASWPFPGVQQALQDRDPQLYDTEVKRVIDHLSAASAKMRAIH